MNQSIPATALNKGWWSCPYCIQDGEPKRTYKSRSQARKIRKLMQDSKAVSAYKCPHQDGWHLGHLPKITRRGDLTRGEVYSQKDEAS